MQLLQLHLHPSDLRLKEGDSGAIAQLAQVDLDRFTSVDAGDQGRHHARIEG